jgi:hypothetical protein
VFAKAARHDFPREWPDLFTALLSQLPGAAPQRVRRTYFVLHHILKELSSKRLVADQKHFAEVSSERVSFAGPVCVVWRCSCRPVGVGRSRALVPSMHAQLVHSHNQGGNQPYGVA